VVPLSEFMQVERYQSKAAELERIVTEVVSEQSYRRTVQQPQLIGEIPVPRSTAHRWVIQRNWDEIETEGKAVDILFSDGTGYKRRPNAEKGIDNHGEVRIALGVSANGTVLLLGAWSGKTWDEISEEIMPRRADREPIAKLFVSDGEQALADGLARLANGAKRCHWHMIHQLDYKMWKDGVARGERREIGRRLKSIAFGWSEAGAAEMARIIIKRATTAEE
jgi:hypothetical protein